MRQANKEEKKTKKTIYYEEYQDLLHARIEQLDER